MSQQLLLMDDSNHWRLDAETREIGRRGVAEAREALSRARARHDDGHDDDHDHSLAA